eukprot:2281525-Amphidinium_carterae.1
MDDALHWEVLEEGTNVNTKCTVPLDKVCTDKGETSVCNNKSSKSNSKIETRWVQPLSSVQKTAASTKNEPNEHIINTNIN